MTWLFAFAALGVVAFLAFAHVGLRAASQLKEEPGETASPAPPTEPRIVYHWFAPNEVHLPSGEVWIWSESEFGWFRPETGEIVPREESGPVVKQLADIRRRDDAVKRARKYGGSR